MSTLHTTLLHWFAAGDEPDAWALLFGILFAQWGGALCAAAIFWAGWRRPSERAYLAAALLACGLVALLSHAIAAHLNYPRPFVMGAVPAYIAHSASASMPSTHASVMFFLAFTFLLRSGLRGTGVFIVVVAALTGWARIYVGVHFPFDIVAGCGLAAALALTFALMLHLSQKSGRPPTDPGSDIGHIEVGGWGIS